MKKLYLSFILFTLFSLIACGPAKVPQTVDVLASETAFVVPLEGASLKGQEKFNSQDFLESKKVAAKRIYLPLKQISTGRMWYDYKWIPTVRVIKVDRKPITFVWENTKNKANGIAVESKDSIGFGVGINISAHVKEADTSLFLYRYPTGNMNKVLGEIVKSKTTEILSRKFAAFDLEGQLVPLTKKEYSAVEDKSTVQLDVDAEGKYKYFSVVPGARQQKGLIVDDAKTELRKFFAQSGVTITTFGLIGGLAYEDKAIQTAINDNFKSQLEIKNQKNERLAQEETNAKNIGIADADQEAAKKFAKAAKDREKMVNLKIATMAAEAKLVKAKKWDGRLPTMMPPSGAGFIMDLKVSESGN